MSPIYDPRPRVHVRQLGPVRYRRRWWHLWTTEGHAWAVYVGNESLWARPPVFGTRKDAEAARDRLARSLAGGGAR